MPLHFTLGLVRDVVIPLAGIRIIHSLQPLAGIRIIHKPPTTCGMRLANTLEMRYNAIYVKAVQFFLRVCGRAIPITSPSVPSTSKREDFHGSGLFVSYAISV